MFPPEKIKNEDQIEAKVVDEISDKIKKNQSPEFSQNSTIAHVSEFI